MMISKKKKNNPKLDQDLVVEFQEALEVEKYFQVVNPEVAVLVNLHLRVAVDCPLSLVSIK